MIQLDSVSKAFGGRTLFQNLSWQLRPGKRIGLVGPNGTGKTTLFKILAGELEYDAGRLVVPSGSSVGLLPQTVGEMVGGTVWSRILEARQDLLDTEIELHALRESLAAARAPEEIERLTDALGQKEDAFHNAGGYDLPIRAKAILNGMGFRDARFEDAVETLSGGWRMRLVLGQLLLQRPSVLLMDEPTNHLDVPSLEWLESFLQSYEGTVVIISHDRYFLNRLVDEVAALEHGQLFVEPGNFDDYLNSRAERLTKMAHDKEQQDKEIERLEAFVTRFRAKASKARQAQSRAKQLDKIKESRITLQADRKQISIRFPDSERSGRDVMKLTGVHKAYGANVVYDGLDFHIERGERIALVGPNGQGKSTLLKMLAEVEAPDAGKIENGHKVVRGYFAQHHIDGLALDATILQAMESSATSDAFPKVRGILGAFLFSGDDVQKRVRVLSGGEKHRVALAQLMLRPTNLLLLDEPTNHLDMESRAVLEDAIEDYEGTVVFVSHDRSFINTVATRVVHIADREASSYYGGYDDFTEARAKEVADRNAAAQAKESDAGPQTSRRDARRQAAERRAELNRRVGGIKKEVQGLETSIEALEAEKDSLGAKLADTDFYQNGAPDEVAKTTRRFAEADAKLVAAYARWEELSEQIAQVESELDA